MLVVIKLLALIMPEAVKFPVKFKSSTNDIPVTLPPADWKLFAKTVPEALILPEAVMFVATIFP